MSKFFVAYRHTGADPNRLAELLPTVRKAIESQDSEIFCTYFQDQQYDDDGLDAGDIMQIAFAKIDEIGRILVIMDTDDKSEGMLMEIGYAIAKKYPITLFVNSNVTNSYVPSMIKNVYKYDDVDHLCHLITTLGLD